MLRAMHHAMRSSRCPACLFAVLGLFLLVPPAWAQPAADGLFLAVKVPITGEFVSEARKTVDTAINKNKRKLSVIVFDFNPTGQPNSTSAYGACHDLADYIEELGTQRKIKTMAFVSSEVTLHTVLPVLACQELVMTKRDEETKAIRAKIGNIRGPQGLDPMPEGAELYYEKLAKKNKSRNLGDVVARMMKPDLPLETVKTAEGTTLYLSPELGSIRKLPAGYKILDTLPPGLERGNALFDADLAQTVGLCQAQVDSAAALAAMLRLPRKVLTENWLMGKTPVVWRIEFKGDTDKGSLDSLVRRINHARANNANFIILQLEGTGGDTTNVASTAEFIRTLKDQNDYPIKTVAYVPSGVSLGAATFLALGCSEIVMAENASLADFSYLQKLTEPELKTRRDMLVPLARKQGYPWRLFEASLDPNLVLYWAQPVIGSGDKLMTDEDLVLEEKKPADMRQWTRGKKVAHGHGQLLKIDSNLALVSGTAQVLNTPSFENLCALYGLDASKVRLSGDGWLDRVAEFFREPLVRFVLVMLGIIGLILELKMPGTAIPGTLAAICFVLFFWSYSFVGEYTMLAVLLFILGIILLAVEIFVLPGFGFAGIAGILLIVCSLTLVTLEKWPTSPDEWASLGMTIGTFGMSLVAAVVSAMIVAWFLPSIPYANRLVLNPPTEEQADPSFESTAPVSLLGAAIGIASTSLRPAGKAQFGDDFHDVIAEGAFVNPGQRVQVIEIEGNRIVVKEI